MSKPTQEERERMAAFASVIGNAENRASYVAHQGCAKEAELIRADIDCLRGCIPVPREEYERMERALWVALVESGFNGARQDPLSSEWILLAAGMIAPDEYGAYTPAAHEFAARMKEKE